MVERFSSRSMLRLAATCVALVGLAWGTACDNAVRAQGSNQPEINKGAQLGDEEPADGEGSTPQAVEPTGGGPQIDPQQWPDLSPLPLPSLDTEPAQAPGPVLEQPGQPTRQGQPGQQGQQGPIDEQNRAVEPGDEDEAAAPDGDDSSGEESPDEEDWRQPVRGSGGNTPPDFIAPAEPKAV